MTTTFALLAFVASLAPVIPLLLLGSISPAYDRTILTLYALVLAGVLAYVGLTT